MESDALSCATKVADKCYGRGEHMEQDSQDAHSRRREDHQGLSSPRDPTHSYIICG